MLCTHLPLEERAAELDAPLSPAEGLELGEVALLSDVISLGALGGISVTFIRRAECSLPVAGTRYMS